ncbi:nuclear transport factor 2 family protein [Roseomonas sp. NAR14]|uniref:Nuclear transport factor 2 family protein n=1 Tax=Roseomonas acroporae TaxID=2937791 RepID=A0A9X1Y864_9PROT|nr:nuclear transport factor 2 family protein [Roseomonas acroporae]MCK8785694.1 nuclear transport factor 2 family protein [Roseomonas acroporae]
MSEAGLVGGSEADRQRILELHHAYIDANARYDWERLQPLFSASPAATFFNLNGFTYRGLEHWTRLWRYYATQVASTYWTPYDIGGVVDAETAVVWCHRRTRRRWVGDDRPVRDFNYDDSEFLSRSTMVFRREADGWRVVHAHFSKGDEGPRPGGI